MKTRISARKIPLEGWTAQVWVDAMNRWVDMSGCPIFQSPDDAIAWGKDQFSGWPA
jgi:hypothetical protein